MAADSEIAAQRMRVAFFQAARLIGSRPLAGRKDIALVGERYRIWSLPSFSYLIVYDPAPRPPRIVRVVHTSRDLPPLLSEIRR